jgi:hypothetical protein
MKQVLCRRLEVLEQIALAEQARKTPLVSPAMQNLLAVVDAWAVDPRLEQLLAEMPREFLWSRVQELRGELLARTCGNHGAVTA